MYRSLCHSTSIRKTLILCPGQGSQYVGMLQNVDFKNSIMNELITTAQKILEYDIIKICKDGPKEVLDRTVFCQPAVTMATMLGFELLKQRVGKQLKVVSVAGYSIGEIPALYISGRITYSEAIQIVKERAAAMDYAASFVSSGLVSMQGLSLDQANEMCEDLTSIKNDPNHRVSVAIEQYPSGVSLGGSHNMLNRIMNREHILLQDLSTVKISTIPVSGAFHTDYMIPAQEHLHGVLKRIPIKHTDSTLYSNVTGKPYLKTDDIKEMLVRQIAEPVLWNSILQNIHKEFDDVGTSWDIYEVGTGKQLKAIIGKVSRKLMKHVENVLM